MNDKPELKPCQNTMCALHGNKGNNCLYWNIDADVKLCCCYSADLAKPSEWISVDDRLPEMGNYIVCLKNNAVMECSFSDITDSPYWFKIGVCEIAKENPVTHWQPIPSPPTRETP